MLKNLPGSVLPGGLLDEDGQLLVEIEVYAAEEARVAQEARSRQEARERHATRTAGGPGRMRRRGG
jgi:hypothetical protein